jgi:hypothetical protein
VNQEEQPRSHLPEGTAEHTFLVYDPETGAIVHGHQEIVLPYGDEAPSHEELEQRALEMAAEVTAREPASLKALKVEHHELEHGAHYRVDPGSGRLERQST